MRIILSNVKYVLGILGLVRIGTTCVKEDISIIPIRMDHAGKEGVTIMLLCVGNTSILTKKGIESFVAAKIGRIASTHNPSDNTCRSSCK